MVREESEAKYTLSVCSARLRRQKAIRSRVSPVSPASPATNTWAR